jgi:polyisoprenoid-binding protein YceI
MGTKIAIVLGTGFAIVLAGLAYIWISGGSGEPTIDVGEVVQTLAPVDDPTTSESSQTSESIQPEPELSLGVVTYDIVPDLSNVQFELDEILSGNPKHVVGKTSEVAGQIRIDFENPSQSELGTVIINIRTLETDNSLRNQALRGVILRANDDENEFAGFAPTAIEGFPDSVDVGDVVNLTVTGDFLLSGITNSMVFEIEVTIVASDLIEVKGTATVLRADYGLVIPNVANVANVSEEVLLVIDLVAVGV